MSKQYKIKRYHKMGRTARAKPHPLTVLLSVVGIAALVFVGISIYEPVYKFIMGEYDTELPQEDDLVIVPDEEAANPEPEPEIVRNTANLKSVYLPGQTALDDTALDAFLESVPAGTDSILIDIKDSAGTVLFNSSNADAAAWGTVSPNPVDLSALSAKLEGRGLSLVVRMSAFMDQTAAYGNRDNAIRYQDGDWLWLDASADAGGKPWLNPYAEGARSYLTSLATEAVDAGAVMVVVENVQFPDGSGSANATFGSASSGVSRQQILSTFVQDITAAVEEAGGQLGVYLPAIASTQTDYNDVRYGGDPLNIVDNTVVLGLLPYQFPTSYSADGLEINQAEQSVADIVRAALDYTRAKTGGDIAVVALLQGGADSGLTVDEASRAEQVAAVEDAGCSGYIFYQTGGLYS